MLGRARADGWRDDDGGIRLLMGPHLDAPAMLGAIGLGAASIACWFYVRFPRYAPRNMRGLATHFVAAALVAQFVAPLLMTLVTGASPESRLFGIFAFALPALVYLLLAGLWLLAWATQMLGRYR